MKKRNLESGQQKSPTLRTPNRISAGSRATINTPISSGHSYAFMPFPESPNEQILVSGLGSKSAKINQSKKEAFLRGNIAVKLPEWMQKADLLPISAYSPKRNHRKSLTYGTPETGSSNGSASCGKAADGGRISTPSSLSKRQLVSISPRGSNKRLQEMSSDVAPSQSQESAQEFDRSNLHSKATKGKPSYESPIADRKFQRVNGMQVDRTPSSEKATKSVETNGHSSQHMKTPVVPEAIVQSSADVAGAKDHGNSVVHKDRIVIVIDDDDDEEDDGDGDSDRIEEDQSGSESAHAAQNFDDNVESENWGRCGTNVGSNYPGEKSITGKDLPGMTQRGSRSISRQTPEGSGVWKPSSGPMIERGVDDRLARHAGTGGSAQRETRLSSSRTQAEAENNAAGWSMREHQGRSGLGAVAGLVQEPRARTSIESSRLSKRETRNPSNTQQTPPIKQPIVIIIPDDDDEDEKAEDKDEDQDEDEDDDTGSEYYEEIVSPSRLLRPIQLDDNDDDDDDEERASPSSVTSSDPVIISAKSSPRKRIKLSQFTRPTSSPTPVPRPDRSRWSSPYKSVHRRFSGPMIITPLRRTPVPAGLGVVDESHYSFPDFGSFPKASSVVEASPRKRQRRYVGSTRK